MTGTHDSGLTETELARAMFPDLASALDAALRRNRAAQGESAAADPESALDAAIDAAVDELPSAGFGARSGDGETAGERRVIDAIARASEVFASAGIPVPEPEAFAEAGVNVHALAAQLVREPGLVLSVAPHGLSADTWARAFRGQPGAPGLFFAAEIERDFAVLSDPPAGVPAATGPGPGAGVLMWTLRAIPAGDGPEVLGLSHAHGPHPTLGEMLTIQLVRAAAQEPPLDRGTFTWLEPRIGGDRLAARHVYDVSEHVIRISAREIGSQGPHQGARPPREA